MKTNQVAIILAERAADHGRLRAVLSEWGYEENEIQRVLKVPRLDQELEARRNTTDDRSGKIAQSAS
jgi:hypothetical protein